MVILLSLIATLSCLVWKCESFVTPHTTIGKHKVQLPSLSNNIIVKASFDEIEPEEFTRKQILKEETEAPFRKIRLFLYGSLGAAAGIGSILTLASLIATLTGARDGNLDEIYQNLAINVLGVPVLGYFIKRDLDAQKSLLVRIQKGGKLAGLRLKVDSANGPMVVKLSDLRRGRGIEKKVVVVVAPPELLQSSIISSIKESKNLLSNNIITVPVSIESNPAREGDVILKTISLPTDGENPYPVESTRHIGLPVAIVQWNAVLIKVS